MKSITQSNDLYLAELCDLLEERCGAQVSEPTIWRTLTRVGFKMKYIDCYIIIKVAHQ